jgi:hypothetical protein
MNQSVTTRLRMVHAVGFQTRNCSTSAADTSSRPVAVHKEPSARVRLRMANAQSSSSRSITLAAFPELQASRKASWRSTVSINSSVGGS